MVSDKMLLNDTDWTISFTVHTDDSDKQLGAVNSQNKKGLTSYQNIQQATA